jgi:hypothetical protein
MPVYTPVFGVSNGATVSVGGAITWTRGVGVTLAAGTASLTSVVGTTVTLSATAPTGGTPAYSYQWQRKTGAGGSYANVGGATSLTLADTAPATSTLYYYKCIQTDATATAVTTNEVAATTAAGASLAAGTASLVGVTDVTASVSATAATGGTAPYAYQWQRKLGPEGTYANVSGATSLALTGDAGLISSTAYYYKCVQTDDVATVVETNEVEATTTAPAGGAVTPVSFSHVAATSTTADGATCTAPTGILDGDKIYAFVHTASVTVTPPAGFSAISGALVTPTSSRFEAFVKTASSESGDYAFTWTDSRATIIMCVLRNAGAVEVVQVTADNTSDTTASTTGLTTLTNDAMLLVAWGGQLTGQVSAIPGTMTAWDDYSGTEAGGASGDRPISVAYELRPTAGATGTRDATLAASSRSGSIVLSIPEA